MRELYLQPLIESFEERRASAHHCILKQLSPDPRIDLHQCIVDHVLDRIAVPTDYLRIKEGLRRLHTFSAECDVRAIGQLVVSAWYRVT